MGEVSSAEVIRDKILAESGGRCCMCAAHISFQVEVVPIVPLNEGGAYAPVNLAALCAFCRWLLQRQKVAPSALKNFKKQWLTQVPHAPQVHREQGLTLHGHPLRLEAMHNQLLTVLEGGELNTLLSNFFGCLDTFLIHEDQHLENATSLAVIRAFRDMYNYVPPEQDIKDLVTADSRKLDLLYRGIRSLFSVGLTSKTKPAKKPVAQPVAKVAAPPAARQRKPAKAATPTPAPKKKAAARKPPAPASRGGKKR